MSGRAHEERKKSNLQKFVFILLKACWDDNNDDDDDEDISFKAKIDQANRK